MDSLWGTITEIEKEKTPEEILEEQFEIIADMTDDKVIGRIERFDKSIDELTMSLPETTVHAMQTMTMPQAQRYLGEKNSESGFTFEVYLSARGIPNYKYRFMLIQRGVSSYPVKCVIEDAIFDGFGQDTVVYSENESDFIELLKKVLSSKRMMSIVNKLYAYS